jgi:hypothetical protein
MKNVSDFGLEEEKLKETLHKVRSLYKNPVTWKKALEEKTLLPFWKKKKLGTKITGVHIWKQYRHFLGKDYNIEKLRRQQNVPQLGLEFYYVPDVFEESWIFSMLKSKNHVTVYYLDEYQTNL